jgi:hypothetical protein
MKKYTYEQYTQIINGVKYAPKEELSPESEYIQQMTRLKDDFKSVGVYDLKSTLEVLIEFQNKVTPKLFIYIFGEKMGAHYSEKYFSDYKRNLLAFIDSMDDSVYYLIYVILTDASLYAFA